MRILVFLSFLFFLLPTPDRASASSVTLFYDVAKQEICSVVVISRCPDALLIRLDVDLRGLFSGGNWTLALQGQTIGLHKHFLATVPQNRKVAQKFGRSIRLRYESAPRVHQIPGGIAIDLRVNPSGFGVKTRNTTTRITTGLSKQTHELAYSVRAEKGRLFCLPPHQLALRRPKVTLQSPALRMSLNIDDIPSWLDRSIAKDIHRVGAQPVEALLTNLQILGFAPGPLSLVALAKDEIGFSSSLSLNAEGRATITEKLQRTGLLREGETLSGAIVALAAGQQDIRRRTSAFGRDLISRSPHWPIDMTTPVWECRAQGKPTLRPLRRR
ncbi:MAG: hypothetical protein ACK4GW_01360 [Pseudorhodobacter sp.]